MLGRTRTFALLGSIAAAAGCNAVESTDTAGEDTPVADTPVADTLAGDIAGVTDPPEMAPVFPKSCEVLVIGNSLGAVFAAHQAAMDGVQVCLVAERTNMLGGQLTEQGTLLDYGYGGFSLSYDTMQYYTLRHYADPRFPTGDSLAGPLTAAAYQNDWLQGSRWHHFHGDLGYSPSDASPNGLKVGKSRRTMSFEPKVADDAMQQELLPHAGNVQVVKGHKAIGVTVTNGALTAVTFSEVANPANVHTTQAKVTIDASDSADLYPLLWPSNDLLNNPVGYYLGRDGTRWSEPSEVATGQNVHDPEAIQPFTFTLAIEHVIDPNDCPGGVCPIPAPEEWYGDMDWLLHCQPGSTDCGISYDLNKCKLWGNYDPNGAACICDPSTNRACTTNPADPNYAADNATTFSWSIWKYRSILGFDHSGFIPDQILPPYQQHEYFTTAHDVSIINWGSNDFGPAGGCASVQGGVSCNPFYGAGHKLLDAERDAVFKRGRARSLGVAHWWQNVSDGTQTRYNNLKLRNRNDVFRWPLNYVESGDYHQAVSPYPYIRETRRLEAWHMITQSEATQDNAGQWVDQGWYATHYTDSVGIGSYGFDSHGSVSTTTPEVTLGTVTRPPYTFSLQGARLLEIPLGALVSKRIDNLLSGNSKTMGVTHITNMSLRTHLSEANAGQAAGAAAAVAVRAGVAPRALVPGAPGYNEALLRRVQVNVLRTHKDYKQNGASGEQASLFGGSPIRWSTDPSIARIVPPGDPNTGTFTTDPLFLKAQILDAAGIITTSLVNAPDAPNPSPSASLTRAQGAKVTLTTLGVAGSAANCQSYNPFTNAALACGSWSWPYYMRMWELGVPGIVNVPSYDPTPGIARSELANYLVETACRAGVDARWCIAGTNYPSAYSDVTGGTPYAQAINLAAENGVFDAEMTPLFGSFSPNATITRKGSIPWLYRFYEVRMGLAPVGPYKNLRSNGPVGRRADGGLEAFGVGSLDGASNLYHKGQTVPNGGFGSTWLGLGGFPYTGALANATRPDGRIDVFGLRTDNRIYHVSQTAPNGGWNAVDTSLAVPPTTVSGSIAAGVNADGRIELFYISANDGPLYHNWEITPNSNNWSGWASLGGGLRGSPAVARHPDGRLEVFGRGLDDQLYRISQNAANNSWGGWAQIPPSNGFSTATGSPSTGVTSDGRIEVFTVAADGALWHVAESSPGSWGGWSILNSGGGVGRPSVGRTPDGRLLVAMRSSTGVVYVEQLGLGSTSGGWTSGDFVAALISGAGDPYVTNNADGSLQVFFVSNDVLYVSSRTADGWSAWQSLGNAIKPY